MSENERHISSRWPWFSAVFTRVALILVVIVVALWLLGYGPGGRHCRPPGAAPDESGLGSATSVVERPAEIDVVAH